MVMVPPAVAATVVVVVVVVHVTVVVAVCRRPLPPSALLQPRAQEQDRGPAGALERWHQPAGVCSGRRPDRRRAEPCRDRGPGRGRRRGVVPNATAAVKSRVTEPPAAASSAWSGYVVSLSVAEILRPPARSVSAALIRLAS